MFWLVPSPASGHAIGEHGLDAPEYRVTVAERAQERPVVGAQHIPGGGVSVMRGIAGRSRRQGGEPAGTSRERAKDPSCSRPACGYWPGNLEAHEARLAGAQPAGHARRPAERPGAAGEAGLPVVRPGGRVRRRRSGRHALRALPWPAAGGEISEHHSPESSLSLVPRARTVAGQLDGRAPGHGRGPGRASAPAAAAAGCDAEEGPRVRWPPSGVAVLVTVRPAAGSCRCPAG